MPSDLHASCLTTPNFSKPDFPTWEFSSAIRGGLVTSMATPSLKRLSQLSIDIYRQTGWNWSILTFICDYILIYHILNWFFYCNIPNSLLANEWNKKKFCVGVPYIFFKSQNVDQSHPGFWGDIDRPWVTIEWSNSVASGGEIDHNFRF